MQLSQRNAEQKVPLSANEIINSDSESSEHKHYENEEDVSSLYNCSCNANIYNAFLIANYRKDLQFKGFNFIHRDVTFGLGFLAYLTAAIQWLALCTMIAAFVDKSDFPLSWDETSAQEWTAFPSDLQAWLLWPFFVIGLLSTYKQLAQIWVDIHILNEWNINYHLIHFILLKYFSECILYTVGSFAFYVTLSWYSRNVAFLDVILKLLAYQYIFMADECAYLLVKDIVRRRLTPDCCNSFFKGTRKGEISRYEMMIAITIPLSISFVVQGIYARTWFTLIIGFGSTILWTFDCFALRCTKKTVIYK